MNNFISSKCCRKQQIYSHLRGRKLAQGRVRKDYNNYFGYFFRVAVRNQNKLKLQYTGARDTRVLFGKMKTLKVPAGETGGEKINCYKTKEVKTVNALKQQKLRKQQDSQGKFRLRAGSLQQNYSQALREDVACARRDTRRQADRSR